MKPIILCYLTTPLRSHLGKAFMLLPAALMLACFAFPNHAHACTEICTGQGNTAFGGFTMGNLTTGTHNTAFGYQVLQVTTTGDGNTGVGANAFWSNTTGNNNVATGVNSLFSNTTGYNNTAIGFQALYSSTGDTAFNNTATGSSALQSNTGGNTNTADGAAALFKNNTGNTNTAEGAFALSNNTSGSSNVALGYNAGANLTVGNNNIDIGNKGKAGEANTIRIGVQNTQKATFIAGIYPTAVTGSAVVINSSGKLGIASSSQRFKNDIKPMENASEAILELKPVTFRYKEEIDDSASPQFGLIAEEVERSCEVAEDYWFHWVVLDYFRKSSRNGRAKFREI